MRFIVTDPATDKKVLTRSGKVAAPIFAVASTGTASAVFTAVAAAMHARRGH